MLLQKIIFSDDSSIADMFYRCSDNKITTQNTSVCWGGGKAL